MMKKILPLFLAFVMVFSSLCISAIAVDNEVEISAATDAVAKSVAGTIVSVPVSIDKNPGLVVGRVTVTWNHAVLKLESISYGEGLGQNNNSAQEGEDLNGDGEPDAGIINDGSYPVSFGSYVRELSANWTETGELFVLNFVVLEDAEAGEYAIGLTGQQSAFLDNDIQDHSVGFSAGKVTVYHEINSVELNVTAPVKGAAPQKGIDGADYTGEITWSPEVEGTFSAATEYSAAVELTAKDGYRFADAVTAAINGDAVTASVKDGKVYVSKAFDKTDYNEISSAVLNITEPANGAKPQVQVAGGTGYTCSEITWSPDAEGTFGANKAYTAHVTLTAAEGYKFAEDFTANVGSNNATVTKVSDFSYTVAYTFGATEKNQIENVALTVTPPAKNGIPQNSIAAGTGYTGEISWNGNPSKFLPATVYIGAI